MASKVQDRKTRSKRKKQSSKARRVRRTKESSSPPTESGSLPGGTIYLANEIVLRVNRGESAFKLDSANVDVVNAAVDLAQREIGKKIQVSGQFFPGKIATVIFTVG